MTNTGKGYHVLRNGQTQYLAESIPDGSGALVIRQCRRWNDSIWGRWTPPSKDAFGSVVVEQTETYRYTYVKYFKTFQDFVEHYLVDLL